MDEESDCDDQFMDEREPCGMPYYSIVEGHAYENVDLLDDSYLPEGETEEALGNGQDQMRSFSVSPTKSGAEDVADEDYTSLTVQLTKSVNVSYINMRRHNPLQLTGRMDNNT
jgi:hypothetical protein